jgi:hypothetical protein
MFRIISMIVLLYSIQVVYGSGETREIDVNLKTMTPPNARGYLMPLMSSLAAGTNSSTAQTAEIKKGFEIYLGMKAMVAVIPDESRSFLAYLPETNSTKQTATIVGSTGNEEFPNGFNWNFVPVMIPQFHIGNIFGTQFTFRYLPSTKFHDKVGYFDLFGGGITHSLSQYLPPLPFDFAIQGFYQQTKLGNVFESNGVVYNFLASARISVLTFYGSLGYENTEFEVEYYYDPGDNQTPAVDIYPGLINFTESIDDRFRATIGLSLQFIIFNLNADYSFGNYQVATVGLGISI